MPCEGWRRRCLGWPSSSSRRSIGGAVTASWTYPQQRQVPYAPYQSRSMIIDPRQRGHERGRLVFMERCPFQSPRGATASAAQRAKLQRRCLPVAMPAGLAVGFGRKAALRASVRFQRKVTAAIHPTHRSGLPVQNGPAWFPRAPDSDSNFRASARSRPPVRSDCDFSNILIPYVRPVNRFRRSECEFRKCLGPALI